MKKLFLLSAFVIISSFAFTQGHFVKKGDSQMALMLETGLSEKYIGNGAALGYSFNGLYDISFSFARYDPREDNDKSSVAYAAGLLGEVHLIKSTSEVPSGFTVHAGLAFSPQSPGIAVIGSDLYGGMKVNNWFGLTANVSFSYYNTSGDEIDDYIVINPRLFLDFLLKGNNKLILGSGVGFSNDVPLYSITFGAVL